MTGDEFLAVAAELGYGIHRYPSGMLLLAAVRPEDADRFPNCRQRAYPPEEITRPERVALEVTWWPTSVEVVEADGNATII
jgi:hypothetical protein